MPEDRFATPFTHHIPVHWCSAIAPQTTNSLGDYLLLVIKIKAIRPAPCSDPFSCNIFFKGFEYFPENNAPLLAKVALQDGYFKFV